MAATGLLPAMAQPTGPIGVQNWLTPGLLGAQNAEFGRDPADHRTAVLGGTVSVLPHLPPSLSVTLSIHGTSRPTFVRSGLLEASVGRWPRFFVDTVPCRGTGTSCWSWRAKCGRCGRLHPERRRI